MIVYFFWAAIKKMVTAKIRTFIPNENVKFGCYEYQLKSINFFFIIFFRWLVRFVIYIAKDRYRLSIKVRSCDLTGSQSDDQSRRRNDEALTLRLPLSVLSNPGYSLNANSLWVPNSLPMDVPTFRLLRPVHIPCLTDWDRLGEPTVFFRQNRTRRIIHKKGISR